MCVVCCLRFDVVRWCLLFLVCVVCCVLCLVYCLLLVVYCLMCAVGCLLFGR